MIQRMTHAGVFVTDQDQAKAFYVGKLGFELRQDEKMGTFRWLTVSPKGQSDFEIILMPLKETPMMDAATVETLRSLQKKGSIGAGVLEVDDCRKTYEELKAKGVSFESPPTERPYGIEMIMRDDSGNWFSVVERPKVR
jgi:catechol 2,3-dioxygenase-like lactoylglutathione lyase family enzyme